MKAGSAQSGWGVVDFFNGMKGWPGAAGSRMRETFATNLGEISNLMRTSYGAHGGGVRSLARTMYRFAGFGGARTLEDFNRFGAKGLGSVAAAKIRRAGDWSAQWGAYKDISGARRLGVYGALGAATLGASLATGYSPFDMAQAGGGGYYGAKMGYSAASKWGPKWGIAGAVAGGLAGGWGAQALGAREFMMGGAGYGIGRGIQALTAKSTTGIAGKIGRMGGWSRAIGAGIGIGASLGLDLI